MSSPPSITDKYKDYKLTSELPPLKASEGGDGGGVEYKVKHVLLGAIGTFLAHSLAFFALFFGIRGSDGEWPEAWWSFCFLGNAITQFWVYLTQNTAVVVRHANSTFEFKNYFGKTIGEPGPFSCYEAVAISNKGPPYAAILRTDEHMANMKSQHPWCACCIGKEMTFAFEDVDKFARDHGMSVYGSGMTSNVVGGGGGVVGSNAEAEKDVEAVMSN